MIRRLHQNPSKLLALYKKYVLFDGLLCNNCVSIGGIFWSRAVFIFSVAHTKKKCAQSEVSPHKISQNWPILRAENTVDNKTFNKLPLNVDLQYMEIC